MMHIRITGKQIVIGEALLHPVREKVSSAVEKHFDRDAETDVTKRLKNHHDRGGQQSLSDPA
jgi:ribosome-associated translation inhibitor RaiA